jgi:hypothetical protein
MKAGRNLPGCCVGCLPAVDRLSPKTDDSCNIVVENIKVTGFEKKMGLFAL